MAVFFSTRCLKEEKENTDFNIWFTNILKCFKFYTAQKKQSLNMNLKS